MEFNRLEDFFNYLEKSLFEGMQTAAQEIANAYQQAVNSGYVPHDQGRLKDSLEIEIKNAGNKYIITALWDTPYAQRQRWEHKTKALYDIKAYEDNKDLFKAIIKKAIESKF